MDTEGLPGGLFKFDIDGPRFTRAAVKFRDWSEPGMLISGAKLRQDAANFRRIARFISAMPDRDARTMAQWLLTYAQQAERAASGQHPQADDRSAENYEAGGVSGG